jgi:hypothetical protein
MVGGRKPPGRMRIQLSNANQACRKAHQHSGGMTMAFVNEYIPEADVEKYGLKEIDAKHLVGRMNRRNWTIDRERNVYLREVTTYRCEMENITKWTFFWKGELLWFDKKVLEAGGNRRGPVWAHIQIRNFVIPPQLEAHCEEIYQDLREAIWPTGMAVYSAPAPNTACN